VKGRKRHLLVDTEGFVLKAVVSAADVQDRDGGALLARALRLYGPELPRLAKVWVDGIYKGDFVAWARAVMGWEVEVVTRSEEQKKAKGFVALPQRWKIERTFGWLGRFRRLSKDYEFCVESSEAFIYLGMSVHMLRRLAAHTPTGST
jgi:putative transposase